MTMRSLIVAAYTIRKDGLFNLKNCRAAAHVYQSSAHWREQKRGVLRNILDKGVQSISPQEKGRVVNQHVAINVQTVLDPRWFFVGGGLAAIIAALWGHAHYQRVECLPCCTFPIPTA